MSKESNGPDSTDQQIPAWVNTRADEWHAYYTRFADYFSVDRVRAGCHPQARYAEKPRGSIVLVHGLSDSPYFMRPLAEYFHTTLSYNVFLPLLHFHGLHEPQGMEGVALEEWKANVAWAIDEAATATPGRVSVGGLSTGGALSFHAGSTNPKVTGEVYLFSAALDLIVAGRGRLGDLAERLLRLKHVNNLLDRLDRNKPLVGDNPYKYEYIDKDGARELARLIKELDALSADLSRQSPYPRPIFAAHSEADDTADISGIRALQEKHTAPADFSAFYIPQTESVSHAGLVLDHNLYGYGGALLTTANSVYAQMLAALHAFESQHGA